jgi:hypothetical protein
MPGVMSRARATIPQGDYLDKDELIREQEPFAIVSIAFDQVGHSFGPRWVCTLAPWFDDQEGPNGLLTMTANPTRNPMFEDLQAQIEENNNEPIGPLTLIKGKSQKGYRFYTFEDWAEPGEVQNVVPMTAPARAARPQASAPAPAPAPAAAEAPKRKAGRPRKVTTEATPAPAPAPVAASKPPETAVAGVNQQLAVGSGVCPDCNMVVSGRVLPDEHGNRFIIHPSCPATGRPSVVPVTEEVN